MDQQRWTDDQLEKMSDDDMRDCVRYVRSTIHGLGLKTDATILTHAICRSIERDDELSRLRAEVEGLREAAYQALNDLLQYEWTDLPNGYAVKGTVDKLRSALSSKESPDATE